ncbi:MAG: hypothetical protein ACK5DN_11600, partial [Hyphomonadaceae bacterium]
MTILTDGGCVGDFWQLAILGWHTLKPVATPGLQVAPDRRARRLDRGDAGRSSRMRRRWRQYRQPAIAAVSLA